jgi:hypothetical protein
MSRYFSVASITCFSKLKFTAQLEFPKRNSRRLSLDAKVPVECWHFNDAAAVCKFVSLDEFESELASRGLERELAEKSGNFSELDTSKSITKWYLFPRRDDASASVLLRCFELNDVVTSKSISAPKVEFVAGANRVRDHLLVSVQDYRLEENSPDRMDGYIDDIRWISQIHEARSNFEVENGNSGGNYHLNQCLVVSEVLFFYFPSMNTLITVGADSAFMVQTGRTTILNERSQVTDIRKRFRRDLTKSFRLLNCFDALFSSGLPTSGGITARRRCCSCYWMLSWTPSSLCWPFSGTLPTPSQS